MPIDPVRLGQLETALRLHATADTAWKRRVAADVYRAVATADLVGDLVAEYEARAPSVIELDDIAGELVHLAHRLDAFGANHPETAGYVAVITMTGEDVGRNAMAFVLQVGQEVDLSVAYQDAHGNAAQVESQTWESSEVTVLTVTDNGDGSATAEAVGVGTAQVQLVADARFGDDVAEIRAVLDVEVVAAEAVSAVITPGEPRDGGATPGPEEPDPEA